MIMIIIEFGKLILTYTLDFFISYSVLLLPFLHNFLTQTIPTCDLLIIVRLEPRCICPFPYANSCNNVYLHKSVPEGGYILPNYKMQANSNASKFTCLHFALIVLN